MVEGQIGGFLLGGLLLGLGLYAFHLSWNAPLGQSAQGRVVFYFFCAAQHISGVRDGNDYNFKIGAEVVRTISEDDRFA